MFKYKTLEGTDIEIIHKAFVEAFSDYQVKMELPLWKLQQMLQRRGYIPEKSMGAFKEDILVGFILNGYRRWNGKQTVYDTGTGVVPEFRKQGLTTNMFFKTVEMLKKEGIEQYLLEVIKTNTAAFELYKKQGFEITRSFSCYRLDKSKYKTDTTYRAEHVEGFTPAEWEQFTKFWDVQPSWQNSIDSINASPETFSYSVVRSDNTIAAYGVIEKKTGDIPQLGVAKDYRRKGIASSLLADLIKSTESEKISVINVEDKADTVKGFLSASGFEHFIDQYEMIFDI